MKHPMQPIKNDEHGRPRFVQNKIVRYMLDNGGLGLNDLGDVSHREGFTADDWTQLAQLIGYSVSGFQSLSYVDDDTASIAADMAVSGVSQEAAEIAHYRRSLNQLRYELAGPMSRLFGIHPDNLHVSDAPYDEQQEQE